MECSEPICEVSGSASAASASAASASAANNQTRKRKIECKPELIIASLQRFYSSYPDIEKVIPYLEGKAPLSLRIIDWFVTKYSRKNFLKYPLNGQEFILYLSYKGQLKAYSKLYFDPNCRRERIMFKIPDYEPFTTTIGKLNFFRWALECGVLDYIEEHEEEIKEGYNQHLRESSQTLKRSAGGAGAATAAATTAVATRRRRTKQTPSALRKLQINTSPVELNFK
jgi:hypothetical protein